MTTPNDMSRIADGLGALETGNSASYTANPRKSARQLVRQIVTIVKPAADAMASTTTAGTASIQTWMPRAGRVIAAKILPTAALTADNTNYATVSLGKHDGAGGAVTTMASRATTVADSGSWVAGTEVNLTLSATLANTYFAKGDVLGFAIAKAGTGVAVPISTLVVYVEWEGADDYEAG